MKLLESKGVPINVHDGAGINSLATLGHDGILSGFALSCTNEGIVYAEKGTIVIHGFRLETYGREAITDLPRTYNKEYDGWNWLILNVSYDGNTMDSSFSFSVYPDYFSKDSDIENGNSGITSRAIAKFRKKGSLVYGFTPLLTKVEDEMRVRSEDIDSWF